MALTVGTRLGHYDVTALIGEGGMGEVYQATDTKLNRQVALKILPEAFASDPDRLARFQREAQVLASLNHPNIAQIHGLEESEGTRALVLELVEGPTLADRIAQGPIPIDEALPIAKQIAEALEAAHEAGVIHRDLKPANIKVRQDGTVKVLDFGLAKALDTTPEGDPSQSPTLTAAATQMGVILGTAAYMSPEQARGLPVDKRADVWAFGVVLYEMLTGSRPFQGEDVSLTLASVMKSDVNATVLPADLPETLRTVIRQCLQKDPKRRIRDVGDVSLAMDGAFETVVSGARAEPAAAQPAGWRQAMPWALGSLALAVITGMAVWTLVRPPVPLLTRLTVAAPSDVQFTGPMRLSLDGRTLAFHGSSGGESQVYLRQLDQFEAVPLRGTEGTGPQAFSPDGQGFLVSDAGVDGVPSTAGSMRRVLLAGGPPTTIAAPAGSAAWGPDDIVVLGSGLVGSGGLRLIRASGGEATRLTTLAEGEEGHYLPTFLPNGRAVLFHTWTGDPATMQVSVYDFETDQQTNLFLGTTAQFATSGHLVFWRDGSLWAVPFDPDSLEVGGDPVVVVEGVASLALPNLAAYTLAGNGTLAFLPGGGVARTLVWVNRQGQPTPFIDETAAYLYPRLSPDETRVAVQIDGDIWICESGRACSPFTTNGGLYPVWTPDGTHVAFQSSRDGDPDLYWKAADGSGDAERLLEREKDQFPISWSPDGQVLAFTEGSGAVPEDIFLLPLDGEPEEFLATPFQEATPTFSPDGRWIAYRSNDSGQMRLYVRPYPGLGGAELVSLQGGEAPAWAPGMAGSCSFVTAIE